MRQKLILALLCLGTLALGGCGRPTFGVGIGIPFTPIGFGVGFPLGDAQPMVHRPLIVATNPPGAELYINDTLVGSTPMTASVPFRQASWYWGQATGQASLLVKKPGYLPQGMTLFPVSDGRVATRPGGRPVDKLEIELRPARVNGPGA